MIVKLVERIEAVIATSSIVVSSSVQKFFGPANKEAYIKGKLIFIDLSFLEFAFFIRETDKKAAFDKYRFQYMDPAKKMVFRYDNAPHHKKITSFPGHKHLKDSVMPAPFPDFNELLEEISAIIIQSIST